MYAIYRYEGEFQHNCIEGKGKKVAFEQSWMPGRAFLAIQGGCCSRSLILLALSTDLSSSVVCVNILWGVSAAKR